jgi:hypothetical protein
MGGGNSGDGHWHAWLWLRSELEGGGERSVSPRGGVAEWERGGVKKSRAKKLRQIVVIEQLASRFVRRSDPGIRMGASRDRDP